MTDVLKIIDFIDNHLDQTGRKEVTPVEANRLLDMAGLLADRPARPGAPLRAILRQGLIPHAYQEPGEHGTWRIPRSRSVRSTSEMEPGKEVESGAAKGMSRNPPWSRDELILALDLYFRVNPARASARHPEVQALSAFLNILPGQGRVADAGRFRNPNGVYMKLCNYLRLDPEYSGRGLVRGGHLEETIWAEYANDRARLQRTAAAIRAGAEEIRPAGLGEEANEIDEDAEFPEGRILTLLHKRRERNPKLAAKKKAAVLTAAGRLECEVCGFDFAARYGRLGEGFSECHHKVPLATLGAVQKTRITDLVIVCANCHRMIHRSKPMMSVTQIRDLIAKPPVVGGG
jgi:5-methylcytosine-specific restriction protein A